MSPSIKIVEEVMPVTYIREVAHSYLNSSNQDSFLPNPFKVTERYHPPILCSRYSVLNEPMTHASFCVHKLTNYKVL